MTRLKPYQRATRTCVAILAGSNAGLDSTTAGNTTFGPSAPGDPGHGNRTQILFVTQSESHTNETVSSSKHTYDSVQSSKTIKQKTLKYWFFLLNQNHNVKPV